MRLGFLACALLLAGCYYGPQAAEPFDRADISASPMTMDSELAGLIQVDKITTLRLESNLLELTIPLVNVAGENVAVLVQITFFDAAGNSYGDETPRVRKYVPQGGILRYTVSSMQARASSFKVQLWLTE